MRASLVDSLVQQRVLTDETQRLHLTASDAAVRRALLADPVISSLRKPDGHDRCRRYKQLLAMQGMTPEQYDERRALRPRYRPDPWQHPVKRVHLEGAGGEHHGYCRAASRCAGPCVLHPADYAAKAQPSDAQLQSYYDAHRADFATPETATIQYLVLSPTTLSAAIKPTRRRPQGSSTTTTSRASRRRRKVRASQILITASKGRERGRQGEGKAAGRGHPRAGEGAPDQSRSSRRRTRRIRDRPRRAAISVTSAAA